MNNNSIFDLIYNKLKDLTKISLTNNELKAIFLIKELSNTKKSIVVVTSTLFEANQLYNNIINYTDEVFLFQMDDFLSSEAIAISPELKTNRLTTIKEIILNEQPKIIITNLMGYLRFLPSKNLFKNKIIELKIGNKIGIKDLSTQLFNTGYENVDLVNKTGDFTNRGYIVDVFPIDFPNPVRIEFWDDEIDSIRIFDVDTQLTVSKLEKLTIFPNTEFLTDDDELEEQKHYMLGNYHNVTNISNYLEHFTLVLNNSEFLNQSYLHLIEEVANYNVANGTNIKYFWDIKNLTSSKTLMLEEMGETTISRGIIMPYSLSEILNNNKTIVVCLKNQKNIDKFIKKTNENFILTNEYNIQTNKLNIIINNLAEGFEFDGYVFLSEKEIFEEEKSKNKYKNNFKIGTKIKNIDSLTIGDYVVHMVYGIGQYLGITTLEKESLKKDYIYIKYAKDDKLYVPVEKIEFLTKYSSNGGLSPKLNKLNSLEWSKTIYKTKKRIEEIAQDLLKLYSIRESSLGYAFSKDGELQEEFESKFEFVETPDQIKVINEIKNDMEKTIPMDRLVCGDVGYGKTEIAFRAIFKAVMDNKQAIFLCPTTILSMQHYKNAKKRFKDFPVNISLLNRFISTKETNEIINKLKTGKTDIVIGTHKLLSNKIEYKNLGLLVIDEEQRFGVKHKEYLKQLKENIDVLSLSATPIPRTLQMSLSGVRGLSKIESPPVDRYPIQTYVLEENIYIIKDAVYKEISRGGQVYLLFNSVEKIEAKKQELNKILKDVKIEIAHGQMSKNEIEKKMKDFEEHKFDVLLCTTIIETGIDIPSVNTIIILNADMFGLSQLYQIRGRVGRSDKIAYCYLMFKKNHNLSKTAIERLKVIKEFTELGSGYAIAKKDLSLRGAGDILGSEQSGFIDTVGIELFLEMLKDEVDKLKGKEVEKKDLKPSFIDVSTYISDSMATNETLKLEIHQLINKIDTYDNLVETEKQLKDRFGHLDEHIKIYMHQELFEKEANKLNIDNITQFKDYIRILLTENIFSNLNITDLMYELNQVTTNFKIKFYNKKLIIDLMFNGLDKHFIYYLMDFIKILNDKITHKTN